VAPGVRTSGHRSNARQGNFRIVGSVNEQAGVGNQGMLQHTTGHAATRPDGTSVANEKGVFKDPLGCTLPTWRPLSAIRTLPCQASSGPGASPHSPLPPVGGSLALLNQRLVSNPTKVNAPLAPRRVRR
jgi:hypothetical protein